MQGACLFVGLSLQPWNLDGVPVLLVDGMVDVAVGVALEFYTCLDDFPEELVGRYRENLKALLLA
jgi:hypothetical protein